MKLNVSRNQWLHRNKRIFLKILQNLLEFFLCADSWATRNGIRVINIMGEDWQSKTANKIFVVVKHED
jgi:hypothetical protein